MCFADSENVYRTRAAIHVFDTWAKSAFSIHTPPDSGSQPLKKKTGFSGPHQAKENQNNVLFLTRDRVLLALGAPWSLLNMPPSPEHGTKRVAQEMTRLRHTAPVASAEKLAIILLMAYQGISRTLLVRGGKQELPSKHQPVARTSLHMFAAQKQDQPKNSASTSWTWPRALGEPEVAHGRSHAVTAWRRGGVALMLCLWGARSYEHFQQQMDIDRALLTRRPRSMGASVAMAHAWVSATSRLRASSLPALPAAHAQGGSIWMAAGMPSGGWQLLPRRAELMQP